METHLPENLPAAIEELVRGQESAKMLRRLLTGEADLVAGKPAVSAEVLVGDVLRSFTNILSALNFGEVSPAPVVSDSRCVKSEESEESSKSSEPRDRRGCYKRRKGLDSFTRLTSNFTDDGYQWRKYGQKAIQSTNFPRNYFRCTYKTDQGCPATKQVQMVSEDPPMYRIIYHGDHTCKTLLKAPPMMLDCPNSPTKDSSILLSFKTDSNNGGTDLMFSSALSCRSSTVKMEANKEEMMGNRPLMNYPISSDSSNLYYLPSLSEVHSSSSYCSYGDNDLLDLGDVFSYL